MTSPRSAHRRLVADRWLMALVVVGVALALGAVAINGLGSGESTPGRSPGPTTAAAASSASLAPTSAPTRSAVPDPSPTAASSPRPPGIVAVRVQVPRLDIDLPIIEGDGMNAPIGLAAHYPGTAWPDAGSNTYLYGHAQEGMFLPLWDIRRADEILLTLVNRQERCFSVDEIIPEAPWDEVSLLMPTDHERLTLQTSTSYTPTSPRFVVIALPCA